MSSSFYVKLLYVENVFLWFLSSFMDVYLWCISEIPLSVERVNHTRVYVWYPVFLQSYHPENKAGLSDYINQVQRFKNDPIHWSAFASFFVQSDWVRCTGGNFQSQENLQRTRSPERVHLVSRELHLLGGEGGPTSHPQTSWYRGVHTDQGSPPPETAFLLNS